MYKNKNTIKHILRGHRILFTSVSLIGGHYGR